jgi:drug/metabolite transporter (DMT)-like permease
MAGTRFVIPGLILYSWRRSVGDPNPTAKQWRASIIVGLLLLVGGNGLVTWAEQFVASGIAAVIVASVPLWIVLFDAVRPGGIRPDWRVVLGVLAGFGGIALLVSASTRVGAVDHIHLAGLAALLASSILWAIGSIFSHSADLPASSLLSTAIQMLGGAAGLFLVGTLAGEWNTLNFSTISTRSWLSLSYLAVVGALVGFVSFAWLLRNAPLPLVSTYAYVNPVVAIFVGAWLGNELLNARIVLAAAVIIGAVILINSSRQARIVQGAAAAASTAKGAVHGQHE